MFCTNKDIIVGEIATTANGHIAFLAEYKVSACRTYNDTQPTKTATM